MDLFKRVLSIQSIVYGSDFSNDSPNPEIFQKSQKKESSIDFTKIFRLACDELKHNQAAHTKARVVTLT